MCPASQKSAPNSRSRFRITRSHSHLSSDLGLNERPGHEYLLGHHVKTGTLQNTDGHFVCGRQIHGEAMQLLVPWRKDMGKSASDNRLPICPLRACLTLEQQGRRLFSVFKNPSVQGIADHLFVLIADEYRLRSTKRS